MKTIKPEWCYKAYNSIDSDTWGSCLYLYHGANNSCWCV